MAKTKIILAFSGGLDTSFSVPYLIEKGYEVVTMTVDTGGFTNRELKNIAKKSKTLGAIRHYQVNGKKKMYEEIVSYIIKTNSLYENSYPNMCADRYIIAQELARIANLEKTNIVSHGSSAMGNDQVRFDVALSTIAPKLKIITPIRETGGNRQKEQAYLIKRGYEVDKISKKYTINQNILGVTYSGAEIDQVKEPNEEIFLWTKITKNKPIYLTLLFEKGNPVGINQKKLNGVDIIQKLNHLAGAFGYGRDYYTGDCIIGIKGHIAFEAPGVLTLIKAHQALEQLVLTKMQASIGQYIDQQFTELLYNGKFFDLAVNDLKKFIDSQQGRVTGKVTLKFVPHQVLVVQVESAFSLINNKVATYAQKSSWTASDAEGFIKLYGLQGKLAASVK